MKQMTLGLVISSKPSSEKNNNPPAPAKKKQSPKDEIRALSMGKKPEDDFELWNLPSRRKEKRKKPTIFGLEMRAWRKKR